LVRFFAQVLSWGGVTAMATQKRTNTMIQYFGRQVVAVALVMGLFGTLASANAAPLLDLYNTGVDAAGNTLTPGSVDPHYQVYSSGYDLGSYLAGYNAGSFVGADAYHPTGFDWGLNTATRGTISFSNGTDSGYQAFTYRTTFDLTGYDPNAVTIGYNAYFDDQGEIAINGVLVPSSFLYHTGPTAGSLSGVFSAGINTIDFVTFNEGGAGGILFEVTSVSVVPTPGTSALFGLGLLVMGWLVRKKLTA
jgi:hypothetical protein